MIDPVSSTKRPSAARRVSSRITPAGGRRASDRAPERVALPAPDAGELSPDEAAGPAAFAAQLLGEGQRRGLKGGPETLDRARSTYLETEWSGPADRRHARGKITKAEI